MNKIPRILAKIKATKEDEVAALLSRTTLNELEKSALAKFESDPARDFEKAVSKPNGFPNIIAEVKKASPSKGIIRPDFNPPEIANAYKRGGAAAISCLTDVEYFQGSLDFIPPVHEASGLPVLRKDFIIHPAQIFEARAAGADAVLLIARILASSELEELYKLAKRLRLGVLLEIHDEEDLEKSMKVSPTLVGVNNRDLDTFEVDVNTCLRMRESIPREIALVAESGIDSYDQLKELGEAGVNAALVGESLMRQENVERALLKLRGKAS